MEKATNPYAPGAGTPPPVIVGRDDQLENFDTLLQRIGAGRPERSMIITGLRGVGKTVLLGQFRQKAQAQKWIVVKQEGRPKQEDAEFRRSIAQLMNTALLELSPKARVSDAFKRAASVLKSFSISVSPVGLTAGVEVDAHPGLGNAGDLERDLTDLFVAVGEAAKSAKRGVVLLIDEVQFLGQPQIESLVAALHETTQQTLPVTLVGAGLPHVTAVVASAKTYSERLFRLPTIGNLKTRDAHRALSEPAEKEGISWTRSALDLAVEVTGGYPYFLQMLGYAVWPVADPPKIELSEVRKAIPVYLAELDSSFYRFRLDRTTDSQRLYLRAMAELGPDMQKADAVAAVLGKTSGQVSQARTDLILMGLLYQPRYGFAEFTVPHFDQFMKRYMSELPSRVPSRG